MNANLNVFMMKNLINVSLLLGKDRWLTNEVASFCLKKDITYDALSSHSKISNWIFVKSVDSK